MELRCVVLIAVGNSCDSVVYIAIWALPCITTIAAGRPGITNPLPYIMHTQVDYNHTL